MLDAMGDGTTTDAAHPPAAIRRVAVLGTGIMGSELVRNLLGAGLQVQVWNRTAAKAEALTAAGARHATSPAAAAAGVDVLITLFGDGAAVNSVMAGPDGALRALGPDAIWVQMSTVGVQWCDRLAHLASWFGVTFVDAPVSGSPEAARRRQLLILACGAAPLAGGPRRRNGRISFAERRIGPRSAAVSVRARRGALAAEYATDTATAMIAGEFAPGYLLQHATKDATLAVDEARNRGVRLPLTVSLLARWRRAIAEGHGADDVASAITASGSALVG
jgi:3-hydroxyisobutyrate dehydrogenase